MGSVESCLLVVGVAKGYLGRVVEFLWLYPEVEMVNLVVLM